MTAPIPVEELEVRAGKVYHSPSLPDGVRNLHFLRNGLYLGELKKTVSSRHSRLP
ncbi:MAG: RsmF rRNA methyltransferase first C-terminal domain-containing protein [Clostridium sp.]